MSENYYDRKDFLRRIFFGSSNSTETDANNVEGTGLNHEKYEFIKEYLSWLSEFGNYVAIRNKDNFDSDNNLKLMELSAKISKHKPRLEIYMQDPVFREHFNFLTKQISAMI